MQPIQAKNSQRKLIIFKAFLLLLKVIFQSFVNTVPKETIISVYYILNAAFINNKELILNQLEEVSSLTMREKIWDDVIELFTTILQPIIDKIS
jgi:FtsH-binding integral membrane protein